MSRCTDTRCGAYSAMLRVAIGLAEGEKDDEAEILAHRGDM
jgi:hypothetical protein